jgi:hypothetical protein
MAEDTKTKAQNNVLRSTLAILDTLIKLDKIIGTLCFSQMEMRLAEDTATAAIAL